ncbi:MAG: hypothetical protein FJ044_02825 [Candidatus Cloacimonetes bacterium]|nr:hypothetical protein [Candidatus Cloacimonadota bacterium]
MKTGDRRPLAIGDLFLGAAIGTSEETLTEFKDKYVKAGLVTEQEADAVITAAKSVASEFQKPLGIGTTDPNI